MGVAKRRYVAAAAMQRTRVQTPVHRFCQTAPKTSCGARSLPRGGSGAMRRTRLALAFGSMDRGSRNISDLRSPGRTGSLAPGAGATGKREREQRTACAATHGEPVHAAIFQLRINSPYRRPFDERRDVTTQTCNQERIPCAGEAPLSSDWAHLNSLKARSRSRSE